MTINTVWYKNIIWKFLIRQFHKTFGLIVHHWLAVGLFLLSNGAKDMQPAPLLLTYYSVFSLQNTKGLPIEIMTSSVGNCIYDRLLWEKVNIYHLVHAIFLALYKACPRLSICQIKIFLVTLKNDSLFSPLQKLLSLRAKKNQTKVLLLGCVCYVLNWNWNWN